MSPSVLVHLLRCRLREMSMKRKSPRNTTATRKKASLLREKLVPYDSDGSATDRKLRFIDLFCGIGGFRLAFERVGCQCVFSNDWDKHSQITYEANFGERPHGDIHSIPVSEIPLHDILCSGFPCQPFSMYGTYLVWHQASVNT